MENVPGLVRLFKEKLQNRLKRIYKYWIFCSNEKYYLRTIMVYHSKEKRVFFVGIRKDLSEKGIKYFYPEPIMGEGTGINSWTCKDAISDLDFVPDDRVLGEEIEYVLPAENEYQNVMREGSKMRIKSFNNLAYRKNKEIISMVPDGGNYKDLPENLQNTRKVHIAWTRMNSNKPCFTIDTGHNHHFHYKENRVPTVRESARIQSFPDSFEFIGIKQVS